jgi:hypothetical protein
VWLLEVEFILYFCGVGIRNGGVMFDSGSVEWSTFVVVVGMPGDDITLWCCGCLKWKLYLFS